MIVLNIPPPPSDRLWYGFKVRPDLGLRIVPFYDEAKLGSDNTMFSRAINKTIDIVVNRWVQINIGIVIQKAMATLVLCLS